MCKFVSTLVNIYSFYICDLSLTSPYMLVCRFAGIVAYPSMGIELLFSSLSAQSARGNRPHRLSPGTQV